MSDSHSSGDRAHLRELLPALRRVNDLRRRAREAGDGGGPDPTALAAAEAALEERFRPSEHLAVYGTLAPGEVNHEQVADLSGEWLDGVVRGELASRGWGTTYGFPALCWDPEGPPVPAKVLVSPDLPEHWPRLDAFEGPGYARLLVPVEDRRVRLLAVANLYVGRE